MGGTLNCSTSSNSILCLLRDDGVDTWQCMHCMNDVRRVARSQVWLAGRQLYQDVWCEYHEALRIWVVIQLIPADLCHHGVVCVEECDGTYLREAPFNGTLPVDMLVDSDDGDGVTTEVPCGCGGSSGSGEHVPAADTPVEEDSADFT